MSISEDNGQPLAIELKDVSVSYGNVPVLQNVSLSIEHGVMVALVGPNGAGKSTLFKAILGLIPTDSGEIYIPVSYTHLTLPTILLV